MNYIYKIVNTKNGKFYIGSAVNFKNRLRVHKCKLNKNKHHSPYLQSAWNKYGEENFKFEIIELVEDKLKLIEREQYWLDNSKCFNRNIGYNVNKIAGSMLGYKFSEKAKLQMSLRNKGKKLSEATKNKMRGHMPTLEQRRKMSVFQRNKIVSKETKIKMSIAQKGRTVSVDHRRKISETLKNKKSFAIIGTPIAVIL